MAVTLLHVLLAAVCSLISLMALLLSSLYVRRSRSADKLAKDTQLTISIVLGSGGHTTEMARLVANLGDNYSDRHYILAESDRMSEGRLLQVENGKRTGTFSVSFIPRSRKVRQSYLSSIFTTLYSIFYTFSIMVSIRPDVVLCNGPGTCVPICFWAWFLDLLLIKRTKIVFVESICRVKRLSLSGLILYYLRIADRILVQWPSLRHSYPRTEYIGRIF